MLSTTTTILESNSCPEMEGSRTTHNQKFISYLLREKKRTNFTPTVCAEEFGVDEQVIQKVTESMERIILAYQIFGFTYSPRPQEWVVKKTKTMNLRDLHKVVLANHIYDKTFLVLIKYIKSQGKFSWVKLLKWKFAAFFSAHNAQDIPSVPWTDDIDKGILADSFFRPHVLLGGPFHDFYQSMKPKDKENFQNTVLNGLKKGAPRVPKEMITEAELKTVKGLSRPLEELLLQDENKKGKRQIKNLHPDEQDNVPEEFSISKEQAIHQIRRTVREIFSGKTNQMKDQFRKPFFPSTSSNYINNRNKLGAVGSFYEQFRGQKVADDKEKPMEATERYHEYLIIKGTTPLEYKKSVKEMYKNQVQGSEHEVPFWPYKRLIQSFDELYQVRQGESKLQEDKRKYVNFEKKETLDYGVERCLYRNLQSEYYGNRGKDENNQLENDYILGNEEPLEGEVLLANATDLQNYFQRDFWSMWNLAKGQEKHYVEALGLAEPLKVRVISKGNPWIQTVLKPVQAFMHSTLRKLDVFSLIGRPLELEKDISPLFDEIPENYEIVSGDYAAATDNLRSWASEAAIDELIAVMAEEIDLEDDFPNHFLMDLRNLLYKCMTKHTFTVKSEEKVVIGTYTNKKGEIKERFKKKYTIQEYDQTNGQLMGSIVSFPFLCLINAAICRYSMECAERKIYSLVPNRRFPLCPLRINGDDCGFAGPKGRIRPIWETSAAMVGLESSIGKTYFSRDLATINSRIFRRKDGKFQNSDYVNFGLLLGLKKSSASTDKDEKVPFYKLGQNLRDLKATCPLDQWLSVKQKFFYFNMNELKQKTGSIPWFLPEWCGGLGFPNDGELSELDRKRATYIKMNYKSLRPAKPTEFCQWQMHEAVMLDLRQFLDKQIVHKKIEVRGETVEAEEAYQELYNLKTVSLLYSHDIEQIHSIIDEKENLKKAIRRNINIFSKKIKDEDLYYLEPMTDEELQQERKPCFVPSLVLNGPLISSLRSDLLVR